MKSDIIAKVAVQEITNAILLVERDISSFDFQVRSTRDEDQIVRIWMMLANLYTMSD